jgi:hypothetical protein
MEAKGMPHPCRAHPRGTLLEAIFVTTTTAQPSSSDRPASGLHQPVSGLPGKRGNVSKTEPDRVAIYLATGQASRLNPRASAHGCMLNLFT